MLYVKSLHIIFVVTWFAGLFYIVRLFIYHVEANLKNNAEKVVLFEQFKLMEKRLWYGITWPSMILTQVFGVWLLIYYWGYMKEGFMHLKLLFVFFLNVYHFINQYIFNKFQKNLFVLNSMKLRIWNEIATILLVAIVFLIVVKTSLSLVWGAIGLLLFTLVIMLSIRLYKQIRKN